MKRKFRNNPTISELISLVKDKKFWRGLVILLALQSFVSILLSYCFHIYRVK